MILHRRGTFWTIALCLAAVGCSGQSKTEQPVGNRFTATAEGGSFTLSESVVVTIPAGAVSEETELEFRLLSASELSEIFSPAGMTAENLLLGIDAKPDGTVFAEPITISFSDLPLDPWDRLFVYELDPESKTYSPAAVEFAYSLTEGTFDLSLTHFSGSAVSRNGPSDEASREEAKKKCLTDCRCVRVKTKQRDREVMCNTGDCQLLETELEVTFPTCENAKPETHYERELTPGCRLGLELSSAKSTVEQGASTEVTAKTHLGCALYPLEGETTTFSSSPLGRVSPGKGTTDKDGKATTVFTAGEEDGVATVKAKTTVTYPLSEMVASHAHPDVPGGTFTESSVGPKRTETVEKQIDITIQSVEHWHARVVTEMNDVEGIVTTAGKQWTVTGRFELEFSFDVDRQDVLEGPINPTVYTSGTATQSNAGVTVDYFDTYFFESVTVASSYFPKNLTFTEIEVFQFRKDGEVHLDIGACVGPDSSTFTGDIYRYELEVCAWDIGAIPPVSFCDTETHNGPGCVNFGQLDAFPLMEGTYTYNWATRYSSQLDDTFTVTFTKE